tara:strand:+ start:149 stop:418 length:270 start_codon:yes stop_codon:yes gene_type:complete
MKITKRQLRKIIREEKQKLIREAAGMSDKPYTVMLPMSTQPVRFANLDDAIETAAGWERDGILQRKGTHPDVMAELDRRAGRHPGGSIG